MTLSYTQRSNESGCFMASIVDNFNKQFRSEDLTRAQYAKEKFLADLFRELVSRV